MQIPFVRPPRCPLDVHAKAWIERTFQTLRGALGAGVLEGRQMVVPSADFFPFRYDQSDASVMRMFHAVAKYMGVEPTRVNVSIQDDHQEFWTVNEHGDYLPLVAAGCFKAGPDGYSISLGTSETSDPEVLIGTIAHELAHLRLHESRTPVHPDDSELLTDLAVFHLGLGVFIANSPRAWLADCSVWPGTDFAKPQYMSQTMSSYALALIALRGGETRPSWLKYLSQDAAVVTRSSIKYLFKTRDSLLTMS
jgi:hypothetical protein